jgi:hypothetical protein
VSQLEVADLLDPALRISAVFLGEVNLSKSKLAITADVTEDIETVLTFTLTALTSHEADNL